MRDLVWLLYQRYLMAAEARCLIKSTTHARQWHEWQTGHAADLPDLPSLVVHFFFERHIDEGEAVCALRVFLVTLDKLRKDHGDIRLFWEFLKGQRHNEELHFLLWILQAIDAVSVGVNYAESTQSGTDTRQGPYVCSLKMAFVTRMMYRLLRMTPSRAATVLRPTPQAKSRKPASPGSTSPSRRKRRSRANCNSGQALVEPTTRSPRRNSKALSPEPSGTLSIVETSIRAYAELVAKNGGRPLPLDCFNSLVLGFTEIPSEMELKDRLGAFYCPTGDERKIPLDIFLVLTVEAFATQMEWRKKQLRLLFIHLAKEEEQEIEDAKKAREEELAAAAAAAASKTRSSKAQRSDAVSPSKQTQRASKKKKSKHGSRRNGVREGVDRYLRGLNRERFKKLLIQSGIATETSDADFDALYVALLVSAGSSPTMISFDQVYAGLVHLGVLQRREYAVDFSSWWSSAEISGDHVSEKPMLKHLWNEVRHISVIVQNDWNPFVRQHGQRLIKAFEAGLRKESPFSSLLDPVNQMRDVLGLAWRICGRRALWIEEPERSRPTRVNQLLVFLTEAYYVQQAVRSAGLLPAGEHASKTTDDLVMSDRFRHISVSDKCIEDEISRIFGCNAVVAAEIASVIARFAWSVALLYDYATSSRTVVDGMSRGEWVQLVNTLELIDKWRIPRVFVDRVFMEVAISETTSPRSHDVIDSSQPQAMVGELLVSLTGFTLLLVKISREWYRRSGKDRESSWRHGPLLLESPSLPGTKIMSSFMREVILPFVLQLDADDFHARRQQSPFVLKVLLDHRPFLRGVFFRFAKRGIGLVARTVDNDGTPQVTDGAVVDEQAPKNARCSLTFEEFVTFLSHFGLLEDSATRSATAGFALNSAGAKLVFEGSMKFSHDDTTHMEFDEFMTSLITISTVRNRNPYLACHTKLNAFIEELQRKDLDAARAI
ncbi:hypothetical protein PINS_up009634 [Pythium insidiosum]|nr:hypothetical protein PINS_up009634 [Pythium insidiosum]